MPHTPQSDTPATPATRQRDYLSWSQAVPDLTALGNLCLEYRQARGFASHSTDTLPSDLIHIVSEICEANEEARKSHVYHLYVEPDAKGIPEPKGFGIELAQAFVLIVGLCRAWNLDLRDLVGLTMAYGEHRPARHGKVR